MRQGFNSGPQFGAEFGGQNWTPVSIPFLVSIFFFFFAPAPENVSHLPRDKFDRSHFASCMSPMVTSANSSHSSLRPLQNQRERFNEKRNSNWRGTSTRASLAMFLDPQSGPLQIWVWASKKCCAPGGLPHSVHYLEWGFEGLNNEGRF